MNGRFFQVKGGVSLPKPLQQPRPLIMNAGGSDRGRRFACEHADMCFTPLKSEACAAEVASYEQLAREEFGRGVQLWTHTFVVQRDTQQEADALPSWKTHGAAMLAGRCTRRRIMSSS